MSTTGSGAWSAARTSASSPSARTPNGSSVQFPVGPNAEWQLGPGETAEDVFGLYRDEIERANAIIEATPLDMAPRQPDPRMGEWGKRFTSLRVVMLHMLRETAVHTGHLEAAGEILDGRQWIVMDER